MESIKLVDKKEKVKKVRLNFSIHYFLCGPFYLFYKMIIIPGFFLLLIYYFFLPIYGMEQIFDALNANNVVRNIFCFFRTRKGITIGVPITLAIHLLIAHFLPRLLVQKMVLKKGYYPYSPTDKQMLIKKCGRRFYRIKHYLKYMPMMDFLINPNKEKNEKIRYLDILLYKKKDPDVHYDDAQIQELLQQAFEEYRLGLITSDEYYGYNGKIMELKEK